jgi:hypothetical protein
MLELAGNYQSLVKLPLLIRFLGGDGGAYLVMEQ